MQIQQGDILVKTYNGEQTYWLSERLVVDVCEVSESYLRFVRKKYKDNVSPAKKNKEFLPDTGKAWRYAKTKNGFYYCYDNIPDRKPNYYKSKLGTENDFKAALKNCKIDSKESFKEFAKSEISKDIQLIDLGADVQYYQFKATVLFNYDKAVEMATAKAWCNYIVSTLGNESYKRKGIRSKQDFLLICTEMLSPMRLEGLKVSSSEYLRHKINHFPTERMEQLEYLISSKYGNDNARIVGKYELVDEETGQVYPFDIQKALIFHSFMLPGDSSKLKARTAYINLYKPSIEAMGEKPVSYRTFCSHLIMFQNDLLISKERHGKDYWKKTSLTYIPSKKLQYAHSLYCADGSGTVNYKYYDKNGKLKTKKLYVMLISDVASRKIVGWSVAPKGVSKEDYSMLEKALKMAIETSERKTMFEFISDNHGAFIGDDSKKLLRNVFNRVRTIEVGNSQANPAEMMFRLFKQTLRGLSNFGSTSWGVSIEGQSNPDYFNIEEFPTYEEAILQFQNIVESWNTTPLYDDVSPNRRYENKHPDCKPMDPRIMRQIFDNHTEVDISYMRGFVQVSKTEGYYKRDTYLFEIPNYESEGSELIAKKTGYKKNANVKVVWNEDMADLYNLEGTYILSCPRTVLTSQSHAEADSESYGALAHHLDRKKRQVEHIENFNQQLNELMEGYEDEENELPYIHQMKTGGNKETYNNSEEQKAEKSIKEQLIEKSFSQNWKEAL